MSTFENSDTDHSDIDAQMRSDMSTMQARLSAVEKELESKRVISQLNDKLIKLSEHLIALSSKNMTLQDTISLHLKQNKEQQEIKKKQEEKIKKQEEAIKEVEEIILELQEVVEECYSENRQLSSENAQLLGHPNPSEMVPLIDYENTEPEYQQSNDNAPDDNQN